MSNEEERVGGFTMRDVLRDFLDFHTKPAGMTVEQVNDKDLFCQSLEGIRKREQELIAAAKRVLGQTE